MKDRLFVVSSSHADAANTSSAAFLDSHGDSSVIADGLAYLPQIYSLIEEYTGRLDRDLTFQNLDAELADLPHKYAEGNGRLAICLVNQNAAGCVAYHRLDERTAEMKRLYVRPQYRGLHLGERLARHIVTAARGDGYERMVLDTLKPLKAAIHLYRTLGFSEIPAYYHNPMPDVLYMGKELQQGSTHRIQ